MRGLILSALGFMLVVHLSWGDIPQTISYQGQLTDASGEVVDDGLYDLTFSLYDGEASISPLWSESHPGVSVENGIFSVILGEGTPPVPLALPFDQPYWLEVQVGGVALAPRMPLTSSAYSLNARSVADGAITSDKIADGQVVKSINSLKDDVTLIGGTNVTITPSGSSLTISAPSNDSWKLTGNAGTNPSTNFLGTTDNQPLELHVNGKRALRLEYAQDSAGKYTPNIIGGYSGNSVAAGIFGATISGGGHSSSVNSVTGDYATISGGVSNTAVDGLTTIGGGYSNTASGDYGTTVSGGWSNTASGSSATIGGGFHNTISAAFATISGGGASDPADWANTKNRVTDDYGTIGGGGNNHAGNDNAHTGDAGFATIGGGDSNEAGAVCTTVGGGRGNRATAPYATIAGGGPSDPSFNITSNRVTDNYGTVSGGGNNQAGNGNIYIDDASFATVSGGDANTASKPCATVAGGKYNEAEGDYASVPGGYDNTAAGRFSFAAGRQAQANHNGCFVWGDDTAVSVLSTGEDQFIVRASGGVYLYTNSALTEGIQIPAGTSGWKSIGSTPASASLSQEDQIRIEELEAENAQLQQRVDDLEERLKALETRMSAMQSSSTQE